MILVAKNLSFEAFILKQNPPATYAGITPTSPICVKVDSQW
jgi:hypothetical protein